MTRFVGSPIAIAATVAFAGLSAVLVLSRPAGLLVYAAIPAGILAFVSLMHTSRALFARWMRFAEALQMVVITGLFGACYLFLVPLFSVLVWRRDPLRLRPRTRQQSSWVARTADLDPLSLERMG